MNYDAMLSDTAALNAQIDALQKRMQRQEQIETRRRARARQKAAAKARFEKRFQSACSLAASRAALIPALNETPGALAMLDGVCRDHRIHLTWVMSQSRLRPVVRARQAAMGMLRLVLGLSYPDIARLLGRDHSTVIYGVREEMLRAERLERSHARAA